MGQQQLFLKKCIKIIKWETLVYDWKSGETHLCNQFVNRSSSKLGAYYSSGLCRSFYKFEHVQQNKPQNFNFQKSSFFLNIYYISKVTNTETCDMLNIFRQNEASWECADKMSSEYIWL